MLLVAGIGLAAALWPATTTFGQTCAIRQSALDSAGRAIDRIAKARILEDAQADAIGLMSSLRGFIAGGKDCPCGYGTPAIEAAIADLRAFSSTDDIPAATRLRAQALPASWSIVNGLRACAAPG